MKPVFGKDALEATEAGADELTVAEEQPTGTRDKMTIRTRDVEQLSDRDSEDNDVAPVDVATQTFNSQGRDTTPQQIESRISPFHWHIYIWHWPITNVKVMYVFIANFSQMVTERANIAIASKYKVAYGLSIGIFSIDLGPYWRSGSRSCTFNISEMVTDRANIAIANK